MSLSTACAWHRESPIRTLLLLLLCIGCIACAILECPDRTDLRKLVRHAGLGLLAAAAIWWFLAYKVNIFAGW